MNPAPFCTHSFLLSREKEREREILIEFSGIQLNHWICHFICPKKVGNGFLRKGLIYETKVRNSLDITCSFMH